MDEQARTAAQARIAQIDRLNAEAALAKDGSNRIAALELEVSNLKLQLAASRIETKRAIIKLAKYEPAYEAPQQTQEAA